MGYIVVYNFELTYFCFKRSLADFMQIGKSCFLGVGSVIIDNVKITDDVQIGRGAFIVDQIPNAGLYVGLTIRRIK